MEGADALGLIAEVGIAIAGFAGVVAALRAPGGKIGPVSALRIGSLLFQSGTTVLLALLPFAFHQAGLSDVAIWRLSSGVMLVPVALLIVGPIMFATFADQPVPASERRAAGVRILAPILFAILTATLVLQAANIALIGQLWPLYVGLLAITTMSLLHFGWILLAPARGEVQA